MRCLVVGGGISGLAGAYAFATAGHDVVLLEGSERLGGRIRTSNFAGRPVDEGADAFLARVPHALALCRALGLDDLVSPATGSASLWLGGGLQAIPAGLVLGVPAEFGPLARSRILSPLGLARAAVEPFLPGKPLAADTTIGALIRRRFGREVHERLVDPLLGGINAGRTEDLSVDVAAPQLAAVARRSKSLARGLRASRAANPPDPAAPVFYAPRQGMSALVGALAKALADAGADVRTDAAVETITRQPDGYEVATSIGGVLEADRVLVTVPAPVAAGLLAGVSASASRLLARTQYASVALITLAFDAASVDRAVTGSGFLVPRTEGRLLTACSIFSNKWPHVAPDGTVVLRASVGRFGDDRGLALDDGALVERVAAELDEVFGLRAPPTAVRVTRFPHSFPQFPAAHLDRVAELEAALGRDAPGLAVAGAHLRGVGIPTCIGVATEAAAHLLT